MHKPFKEEDDTLPDDGIIILRQTRPMECGGTDATQDTKAPKVIQSREMVFFEIESALNAGIVQPVPEDDHFSVSEPLYYIHAFAVPAGQGCFLFLETSGGFHRNRERNSSWHFTAKNIFPSLVKLVQEHELAKGNGFHSCTHGLPENFGGSVMIRYASGEKISFSNNQSPIFSTAFASAVFSLFQEFLQQEAIPLPNLTELSGIRFSEERQGGGYTRVHVTILEDGSGSIEKTSRYDSEKVYESTSMISQDDIGKLKKTMENCGMLVWDQLQDSAYHFGSDKSMSFLFRDGREITFSGNRQVPDPLSRGFFAIELEITTKH